MPTCCRSGDGEGQLSVDSDQLSGRSKTAANVPIIGVLAIQGDYEAHARRLEELGAKTVLVRKPDQLDGLDGIVMPGGESSTMLKFLERDGFLEKLKEFVRLKPSFGTCAGAILLAKNVENPVQVSLGAMDMTVRRNAYGRQIDSHIHQGEFAGEPLEMVFIRAPKISAVGKGVEVLLEDTGEPVWVRQGKTMAATFHPELSPDKKVHEEFVKMVKDNL
jgi:5'-phosphate synthase pdxT subunit